MCSSLTSLIHSEDSSTTSTSSVGNASEGIEEDGLWEDDSLWALSLTLMRLMEKSLSISQQYPTDLLQQSCISRAKVHSTPPTSVNAYHTTLAVGPSVTLQGRAALASTSKCHPGRASLSTKASAPGSKQQQTSPTDSSRRKLPQAAARLIVHTGLASILTREGLACIIAGTRRTHQHQHGERNPYDGGEDLALHHRRGGRGDKPRGLRHCVRHVVVYDRAFGGGGCVVCRSV